MKQETILQSLAKIEYIIYQLPYDDLSEYLQGVRDMMNLINGEEPNVDIANNILEQVVKQKVECELPF
jgi:hypothetical protein